MFVCDLRNHLRYFARQQPRQLYSQGKKVQQQSLSLFPWITTEHNGGFVINRREKFGMEIF